MSQNTPIRGHVLRERLLELGISDRAFAKSTGLGDIALRSIVRDNAIHGSVTLATLRRVLTEAGLTAADLLDDPVQNAPAETPDEDTITLAHCLLSDTRRHPEDRMAVALGWTLDRVRAAVEDLNTRLQPVGLHVHTNNAGIKLQPVDTRAADAIRAVDQYRDADDGLDNGTARILYAAYAERLSSTDTAKSAMPKLAALLNRGLIKEGRGDGPRFALTEPARVAVEPPDHGG